MNRNFQFPNQHTTRSSAEQYQNYVNLSTPIKSQPQTQSKVPKASKRGRFIIYQWPAIISKQLLYHCAHVNNNKKRAKTCRCYTKKYIRSPVSFHINSHYEVRVIHKCKERAIIYPRKCFTQTSTVAFLCGSNYWCDVKFFIFIVEAHTEWKVRWPWR